MPVEHYRITDGSTTERDTPHFPPIAPTAQQAHSLTSTHSNSHVQSTVSVPVSLSSSTASVLASALASSASTSNTVTNTHASGSAMSVSVLASTATPAKPRSAAVRLYVCRCGVSIISRLHGPSGCVCRVSITQLQCHFHREGCIVGLVFAIILSTCRCLPQNALVFKALSGCGLFLLVQVASIALPSPATTELQNAFAAVCRVVLFLSSSLLLVS